MTAPLKAPAEQGITPEQLTEAMDADFGALLDKTFSNDGSVKGSVVKGQVTAIEKDIALVDIGMKAEGRIPLSEFADPSDEGAAKVAIGDHVDVFVESLDDRNGEARLSREKAKREEALANLEAVFAKGENVMGTIFGRVKGGFAVDVQGVLAFLPGSQVDVRPMRDIDHLMNAPQELQILKLDRKRGNVIVSRRAIMDEQRSGDRDELLKDMEEGKVIEGIVKNITDYGAFIDLGGIDGLLHITDIAWHRINHPSEVLTLGQSLQVQVIRFDKENKRVSLGLKQMANDPWSSVDDSFPIGARVTGAVTNITDYGAFVELAPGVEGLIHVSEMSWTRKNTQPGKILATSEEVEVQILEIDRDKRRISLGLKQCQDNPWQAYAKENKEGDKVTGTIRSITEFGVFVGLTDDIDGLIHVSDVSWDKEGEDALADFKKGQEIEATILALDPSKERVALGLKQMSGDPLSDYIEANKKGSVVKATILETSDDGIKVELAENVDTFIKARDLSAERDKQNTSRFKVGDTVDVKLTAASKRDRKLGASIKAMEIADEREAIAEYAGKEEGAATLGDALGDALKTTPAKKAAAKKAPAKKAAAKKAAPKAKKADEAASEE